jgi:dipeptidyl aminopeptidase/acylaminoacyl peptidase
MVLGDDAGVLAQRSPANQAAAIKAKVMLISGGEDKRVPPVHSEAMRSALSNNGQEVVWLHQSSEGHGYYKEENVTDMYEKIIAFLDQNIGAKKN